MLKKKLKVFIIIVEDLRGAYIMITSMLKVQDFKNVWKDYRTICIIAVAVVAVLLLLFIIEAVRAHKKAKAFKNQLNENKKLSREVEDLKTNQNTDVETETSANNEEVTEEPQTEEEVELEENDETSEETNDQTTDVALEENQTEEAETEDTTVALDEAEPQEPVEEPVEIEETTAEETLEPVASDAEETVQADEPKNENEEVTEETSEPVASDAEETVVEETKEEPIAEEPKDEPIAQESKENSSETVKEEPVEQPMKTTKKTTVKKTKAEKTASDVTEEPKKTNNRAKGKYEIVQDATGFKYYLKASNGETLIVSESYTTLLGCKNAIKRLKENTLTATIKVEEDKNHNFQFHVVKGTRVVAHSANYNTKVSAQNASKAFAKYVNTDVIKLQEESKNDLELVTLDDAQISTETVGKILVSKENDLFLYKLIANNGQTICMSATYKTMVTIQKSIESFRDAVYDGKFYIQKDKNDRYQFKLYNKASRLIMTGESFQTADSCRSNILSCYRFAKNAPIEYTDEALQK